MLLVFNFFQFFVVLLFVGSVLFWVGVFFLSVGLVAFESGCVLFIQLLYATYFYLIG